jgi:hypothetical protein
MAFAAADLDEYRESLKRKKTTDSTLTGDGQDVKLEKQVKEAEADESLPAQ